MGRCQLGRTEERVPGRLTPISSSQRSSSHGTTSGLSERPSHSSSSASNPRGSSTGRPSRSARRCAAWLRSFRTRGTASSASRR